MANDGALYSAYTGAEYDRLQPIKIEHYDYYHELALDFVPFDESDGFRMLDLGPGTSTFAESILRQYPKATIVALEYAQGMIDYSRERLSAFSDRIEFSRRDLNDGLPANIGRFEFVSAFSAIHHLTPENKQRLYRQIYDVLEPGGWFSLIDAMTARFDNDVYALNVRRRKSRLEERYRSAGIEPEAVQRMDDAKTDLAQDAPDLDRLSPFSDQIGWMKEAGFRSVDHIWHDWMEHFIICRR